MTRDDIIRMAREAGFVDASFCRFSAYTDDLERFAALVRAAEREACAKVCEDLEAALRVTEGDRWYFAKAAAAAIRKRGEVQP